MMSFFRAFLNTWAARAFFVVLVAAFGLWGIADVVRNYGKTTSLATVGARTIEPQEFEEAFHRNLAQVTRMMGNAAEPPPDVRRSVAGESLERLIVQAAIADEVQRLGIEVPDAALRQAVFAIPAFHGSAGTFDRATFESVMRNNNMTEPRFLDLLRSDIGQRQLMETIQAGVTPPETLLKQVYAFQRETRSAQVVELPFSDAPAPPAPSPEDLQREYENDPAAYSAPAYRRIKLVVLSPQTLAGGIEVKPEDIQAYYEAHKADYVSEEKRAAEVIVAPDKASADKLAAEWKAGADWAAMDKSAQAAKGSAVRLDASTRDQFPSPELADAVFAAPPDTVSAPIPSAFGFQIIRVTQVIPGQTRTLDQVKDSIRQKIAQERAVDQVYTRANKLDDALSAGTSLDDLPGELGAAGVSGTLDAQGNTPAGEPAPIPGSPALRKAIIATAFSTPKGDAPHMIEGPDQSYYALAVEDITEPKLKPLTEVEAQVKADWEAAARRHEQDAAAAKLMTAAQAGGSLDDAATIAGFRVDTTPPVTRDGTNEHVPPPVQQALFRLKKGETTMVETADAFWVVRLTDITDPDIAQDPVGAAQFRDALTKALDQDMEVVFATAQRDRAQPRVNREMLDSLLR
ncbi:MAG: peptidyl-prolyl cis-trans isomerase [Acetobacteraceae bacterium]|nr:peptidyl-prolyl cis-trans isomerase [Acetobacteraceae bacterium]